VLTPLESNVPPESTAAPSDRPGASVVMTVYNDFRFLDAAVDSILQQEFRDLELIIVDDGSGKDAIFEALARRDPRIRIVVNPTNIGTAAAANRGIDVARAEIIVRLDADDIAEPARVGRLVAALAEDPRLGLVGSAVTLIDEADRILRVQPMPETDIDIRWTILFHNPFYHSAAAFRRDLFEKAGRYIVEELVSQDHYMWFHLLPLCRARNLAEPLTRYRENPLGLTATHMTKNPRSRTHKIREALWQRLGLTYDLYDDAVARSVSHFLRGFDVAPEHRAAAYRSILTVLRAFLASLQPGMSPEDAEAARRLRHSIVARILAHPPDDPRETLTICRLCWPIDRSAAMSAAAVLLAKALKMKWRAATTRFARSRAN
jgi:glycosyltransferase involved in cell wall biosynthesis